MTDLPVALWAGLYVIQLLLALALGALRLERAPRHDALRRARGAAILVAVLPVPGLGLVLGAIALVVLPRLRQRADDAARQAGSRLAASPLRPGRGPDAEALGAGAGTSGSALPSLPDLQALEALPDPLDAAPRAVAGPLPLPADWAGSPAEHALPDPPPYPGDRV